MLPHTLTALTTQVEVAVGGLTHAATRLSRLYRPESILLGPAEVLALFSELSDEMATAVALNPAELGRLIGIIDDLEQLSRCASDGDDKASQLLCDPKAFFLPKPQTSPQLEKSLAPSPTQDTAGLGLSASSLLTRHFPRRPFKTDRLGLYLALQSLLSLCRSISTTEEVNATLQRTIHLYGGRNDRPFYPSRPVRLMTESLQRIDTDEARSGTETRERLRAEVGSRSKQIIQPDFIQRVIYPLVFKTPLHEDSPNHTASVIHEIGSGRITVSYRFDGKIRAYGKLYASEQEALHCTRVLTELWNNGFDDSHQYRVPALLAYLPELKLIVTDATEGRQFSSLLDEGDPEISTFVARQAARWLVQLHRSPIRTGSEATLWDSMELFRLLRRLAKAASRVPEQRSSLVEMVGRVCEAGIESFQDVPKVQTHGKFHYEHVLIEGPVTTVIDLDGSVPSDPAVDIVEFLRVMRWRAYKMTGSQNYAERPTRAFLEEYLSNLPENCRNLAVYWAASTLLILLRKAKKYDPKDDVFNMKMQFLKDEINSILSGKLPIGPGSEIEA